MRKYLPYRRKERKPPVEPLLRYAYGAALLRLLEGAGITPADYPTFGEQLAKAQIPERAIPYHDFTIQGWVRGELLPTAQAQEALIACLHTHYGVAQSGLNQLDDLHDVALDWQATQGKQPTELTHALTKAIADSGMFPTELAPFFAEKNKLWARAREENAMSKKNSEISKLKKAKNLLPQSDGAPYAIIDGDVKFTPSRYFTYAVEEICHPSFSLRAIHENMLRERADQLWQSCLDHEDEQLGGFMQACRIRLGENMVSFIKRIGRMAGDEDFGAKATCFYWENNINLPAGDRTHKTLYIPIVQSMKLADTAPSGLSRAISTPWFDTTKEDQFRAAFTRAVNKVNAAKKIGADRDLPPEEPVDLPDRRTIPASLCRYDGKLRMELVNGHPREKK